MRRAEVMKASRFGAPGYPLAALVLCSVGCLVGPKYQAPVDVAPQAFKEQSVLLGDGGGAPAWVQAQPSDASVRGAWWKVFGQPELDQLEDALEVDNQNIKQYFENFMAARALIAEANAGYWPTVAVGLGYSVSSGSITGAPGVSKLFTLPVDVSWAPDLWGKVGNTVRHNQFAAQLSAADLANERLTEQASLAQYYFQIHGQDALADILDETVAADQRSLQLNRAQYETGVGTEISVVEAQNTLETAQAAATNLGIARALYEHAMAQLLGRPPSGFGVARRAILASPPPPPAALPSQLLERRPDIAAAERNMAAANAQIGVAYAAYFPSVSLSLSGGLANPSLEHLFEWPSRFWTVGPSISETVFEGGLRRATLDQYIATYNANLAAYRQTVLVAFQQVEDGLATARILRTQVGQEELVVASARRYLQLEQGRYDSGVDPYVDVLIAQNTLLTARQTLALLQVQDMTNAVQLIEVLGGGWDRSQLPSVEDVSKAPTDDQRRMQK